MRAVIQRVKQASVTVEGKSVGSIDKGFLVLLGVHRDDAKQNADALAKKCTDLRIFSDAEDRMNLSLLDIKGEALVVSQFTLYADCSKGRRPSFIHAAPPEKGNALYQYFVSRMRLLIPRVETGVFGAIMEVSLVNNGPVTIILEE